MFPVHPQRVCAVFPRVFVAVREAAVGDGAEDPEREEAEDGVLPHQRAAAVPRHVPDRAGQPRGRVGLRGNHRGRLRGLGNCWCAQLPHGARRCKRFPCSGGHLLLGVSSGPGCSPGPPAADPSEATMSSPCSAQCTREGVRCTGSGHHLEACWGVYLDPPALSRASLGLWSMVLWPSQGSGNSVSLCPTYPRGRWVSP